MGKKLAFVGAGAVGSYVGGLIANAGEDVTLIDAWPDHINTIKNEGLKISGSQGEHHVSPNALHLNEVQSLIRTPVDIAFICTKSYDTAWATLLIKDYLAPDGFAVSLQNGINEENIAGLLGWGRVVGCIASNIGVGLLGPGSVTRTSAAGGSQHVVFRVGEVHGAITPRIEELVLMLEAVDSTKPTNNLWGERWSKLVANSMGNGLQAITGFSTKAINQNPAMRRLTIRLAAEAIAVGQALGYELVSIGGHDPTTWLNADKGIGLEDLELSLIQAAERHNEAGRSSTAQDMAKGRRLEIEYLNGLVVKKGTSAGIDVSANAALMEKVKAVERGALAVGLDTLSDLA